MRDEGPGNDRLGSILAPGEGIVWRGRASLQLYMTGPERALFVRLVLVVLGLLVIASLVRFSLIEPAIFAALITGFLVFGFVAPTWCFVRSLGEGYVITNRRVLIIDAFGRLRLSVDLIETPTFSLAPRKGERGTVLLAADPGLWRADSIGFQSYIDIPRLRGVKETDQLIILLENLYQERRNEVWGDPAELLP